MSTVAKQNSIAKRKDGSLSREHFSLREFRLVAKLRFEGAADEEIVERAVSENLFQYPTLSNAARMAAASRVPKRRGARGLGRPRP